MHFIERAVDEHRPIVLSLRYGPAWCHIVPVLGYDEKWVYFLENLARGRRDEGRPRNPALGELARRDQEWGQCQTAWLETKR